MRTAFIAALFSLSLGRSRKENADSLLSFDTDEPSHVDAFGLVDTVNSALDSVLAGTDAEVPEENTALLTGSSSLKHNVSSAIQSLGKVDLYLAAAKVETTEKLGEIRDTLFSLIQDAEAVNDGSDFANSYSDRIRAVNEAYLPIVDKTLSFVRNADCHKQTDIFLMQMNPLAVYWEVSTWHLRGVVDKMYVMRLDWGYWDSRMQDYFISAFDYPRSPNDIFAHNCWLSVEYQTEYLAEAMAGYLFDPIAQAVTQQGEAYFRTLVESGAKPASEVLELLVRVLELAKKYNIYIKPLATVTSKISDLANERSGESALYL